MILSTCVLGADSERMGDAIAEYSVVFASIFHGDDYVCSSCKFLLDNSVIRARTEVVAGLEIQTAISSGTSAVSSSHHYCCVIRYFSMH